MQYLFYSATIAEIDLLLSNVPKVESFGEKFLHFLAVFVTYLTLSFRQK